MNKLLLKQQLTDFLNEDIGFGDKTSLAVFNNEKGEAVLQAKSSGIFCGEEIVRTAFSLLSQEIQTEFFKNDGDSFSEGDLLVRISGPVKEILSGERVVLNLVQRLSAIASLTYEAAEKIKGTKTRISDTRKTTPGLRMLEKYAVRCGGGINHRFGLDDAVLVKDNHIAAAGSVAEALRRVKKQTGHMTKIEVEVENSNQLVEAVAERPDVIMLDNCTVEEAAEMCRLIPSHITVEFSGGVGLNDLKTIAEAGVDVISMGALTHSVRAKDISLNILIKEGIPHV